MLIEDINAACEKEEILVEVESLEIVRGKPAGEHFLVKVEKIVVPKGKIVSIIGTSGCGKSTLLTVLGLMRGLQQDPETTIRCKRFIFYHKNIPYTVFENLGITGRETKLALHELENLRQSSIGFCLQGGDLLPSLSLIDNVAVTPNLSCQPNANTTSNRRLRDFNIGELATKYPGSVSGGQKQRAMVARALAHGPDLIILDEPTSALDHKTAHSTLELLKRSTSQGQTVLMVTHDQELARKYSNIIYEMENPATGIGVISKCIVNTPDVQSEETPAQSDPVAFQEQLPEKFYPFRLGIMDALGPLYHLIEKWFFDVGLRGIRKNASDRNLGENTNSDDSNQADCNSSLDLSYILKLISNAAVLIAISLMILILIGMRAGLIEEFRQSLIKSPTGRELQLLSKDIRKGLTESDIADLQTKYPEFDLIIPMSKNVLFAKNRDTPNGQLEVHETRKNDPILSLVYLDQDFSNINSNSLILPESFAQQFNLNVGDKANLWVKRVVGKQGEKIQYASLKLDITHVIRTKNNTGYIHSKLAQDIEDYKYGRSVPSRNWPGYPLPISPRYLAGLLVARSEISEKERRKLKVRGLVLENLQPESEETSLYGWLKSKIDYEAEGLPPLNWYWIKSGRQSVKDRYLSSTHLNVENLVSRSDAIVFLWAPPLDAVIDNTKVTLIGLSARTRWLAPYLRKDHNLWPLDTNNWVASANDTQASGVASKLELECNNSKLVLPIIKHASSIPNVIDQGQIGGKKAVKMMVPAVFLSRLHMVNDGLAMPDIQAKSIRPVKSDPEYPQVRAYVQDVYQVATLHDVLSKRFIVRSNNTQIKEMMQHAETLGYIVTIITIIALISATGTAFLVFKEIGEIKRRMIATLRIMGLKRSGVFVLMIIRSLMVAVVAVLGVITLGVLFLIAGNIFVGPTFCILSVTDFIQVIVGIVAICIMGVLMPAITLSKMDPVVAFEEANKFI